MKNYTPEKITSLKENEVFVFGSNLNGNHAGGAAYLAVEKFGAQMGNPEGIQGQSYAGAILVIAEENEDNYNIASWKAVVVDGVNVKPDTWYMLQNGELVEDNNKN